MLTVVVALALAAEPRFLGGVAPAPLTTKPMAVDEAPTERACSTETLRVSTGCHFDARPAAAVSNDDRARQSKDNIVLADRIGQGLCRQRNALKAADPRDVEKRVLQCTARVRTASLQCDLEGAEALIDTTGRFSTLARGCYAALAEALQLSDVPSVPTEAPPPAHGQRQRQPSPTTEL